jgi:hypothetical protein
VECIVAFDVEGSAANADGFDGRAVRAITSRHRK